MGGIIWVGLLTMKSDILLPCNTWSLQATSYAHSPQAAQTTIALVSVEIQIIDGTNYNDTYINHGKPVYVPDLSCYWRWEPEVSQYSCVLNDSSVSSQSTTQLLAHDFGNAGYGAMSASSPCGVYTDVSDILC